jgi:NTE family protein
VNPVPVSLCRAMGTETVVAVDLNTTLLGSRIRPPELNEQAAPPEPADDPPSESLERVGQGDATTAEARDLRAAIESWANELRGRIGGKSNPAQVSLPSLYEVLANSLNIMQIQITRSRMAGDPPDLLITPRLADFALLDLDRGDEAIEEGRRAAELALTVASQSQRA